MNDIHEDDSTRWAVLRSTFKQNHPELLIGSPYPTRHGYGYPADDFTWAFDFAHKEVRDRKLGLILETGERYDIDGFELDFQRGAWFFKDGKEAEGMPRMTDFMRQVREGTNRIAETKDRTFTLMLRVPPTVAKCRAVGLDIPSWIKAEVADLLIPMDKGNLDMGASVKELVEMAEGTSCSIGAGLEHMAKGYGYAGTDMLYAAALGYWHQGASSIYLFNYDCHRLGGALAYTAEEIQVLKEIHDPERIARKNKRYCVAVDLLLRAPDQNGECRSPMSSRKQVTVGNSRFGSETTSIQHSKRTRWMPHGSASPMFGMPQKMNPPPCL